MGEDARLREIIDAIYAAALSREDPTPLYGRIAQFLGFKAMGLVTVRSRFMTPTCHAAWGIDVATCQRMEERYGMTRWVVERLGGKILPGEFHFRSELVSDAEFRTQPAYHDFHRRHGLDDGATLCVENSTERLIFLNFAGPLPGADRERQRTQLGALAPHWVRATQIYLRLEQFELASNAYQAWANFSTIPAMLYDNTGALCFANARAEALAAGDGLRLERGELHADDDADDARLGQAIREAVSATRRASPPSRDVRVRRASGKRPFRVTVMPLVTGQPRDNRRPAALVVIFDPEAEIRVSLTRCCELFGFTPAEAQVALGVMNGRSLEQIATAHGRSIATSRNLLKRAFSKTGVNRQSELTHLMLNSSLFLDTGHSAGSQQRRPGPHD